MATDTALRDDRPLIMHVVYRFDTGGLENGIVNLINHLPASAYRHAIVALTEVTDFRKRIRRELVEAEASLRDLAVSSGLSYDRLTHLTTGLRRPRPDELRAIVAGLARLAERRTA